MGLKYLIFLVILAAVVIFVNNAPSLLYQLQCSTPTSCLNSLPQEADPSCRQIQNPYERAGCQHELAVARHDPVLCISGMPSSYHQSECVKAVIAESLDEPEVIEKFRDPTLRGLVMYMKYDVKSKAEVYFSIDEYFLDLIINKTDLSINDSFICEEIQDTNRKDHCYSQIAVATQNSSVCDKILLLSRKDNCYSGIAWAKQDPLICDKILDIMIQNGCYLEVAWLTKDSSVCDKIKLQSQKDICYQVFTTKEAR